MVDRRGNGTTNFFLRFPDSLLAHVLSFLLLDRIENRKSLSQPSGRSNPYLAQADQEGKNQPVPTASKQADVTFLLSHPREDVPHQWNLYDFVKETCWFGWHIHTLKGASRRTLHKEVTICSSVDIQPKKAKKNRCIGPTRETTAGWLPF